MEDGTFTQAITQTSLAKYIEVPESCSAEVDVIREMASTIKTEVLTELSVMNKRLHQIRPRTLSIATH